MLRDFLSRVVPRNLVPQRAHTEMFLRMVWEANAKGSIDQIFADSGMDEVSIKNCFDILDDRFGKELKSNDKAVLDSVVPTALYALTAVIEHYSQATQFGTRPYRRPS